MISNKNFETIRNAIENRDFVGWKGLPDSCSPDDIFEDFSGDLINGASRPLGKSFKRAIFSVVNVAGYYRPTINTRDGVLILFDGMNPELAGGFVRLHEDLGEPAARLDWAYGTLKIPLGEWVYPERGITVFLNTTADKALHIALYSPADLETYVNVLRPDLSTKRMPRPR